MFKVNYIGTTTFEAGKHVVLTQKISSLLSPCHDNNYQIFVPEGYKLVNYNYGGGNVPYAELCYVNTVPVRVKVYEKKGQKFCPEFGSPVSE